MLEIPKTGPLTHLVKHRNVARARATGIATAAEAIGPIGAGDIIVGVTKGGFSLLDIIQHFLSITGPAEVDVSTWTAGVYDMDVLWQFAERGDIKAIRFLLDPAMFGNRPQYSKPFLAAFGGASIRAVDNHAKFATVAGKGRFLTATTSMNLNRNKRLENFVIFDSEEVWRFHRDIIDRCFETLPPYSEGQKEKRADFDAINLTPGTKKPKAKADVW